MASNGATEPLHMDLRIFEHLLNYIETKAVAQKIHTSEALVHSAGAQKLFETCGFDR